MISVSVDVDHDSLMVDSALLQSCVDTVLTGEGINVATIGVILTDHDFVRQLNVSFLDHDYETDVLSFNMSDETSGDDGLSGEVYVDVDTALERCREFGASFEQEVCRYVVHGVLHLAGHDDSTAEAREGMRKLEDEYLSRVGLGDA